MSSCCRHKYDRSIFTIYLDWFLAVFLYLAQLCVVSTPWVRVIRILAYLMWHVCAKKSIHTYLLLVGLSTKPKLILPYMYCQSVLHTCLQKLSQWTVLVFKQILGRAIFLFLGKPINSKKKKKSLLQKKSNVFSNANIPNAICLI